MIDHKCHDRKKCSQVRSSREKKSTIDSNWDHYFLSYPLWEQNHEKSTKTKMILGKSGSHELISGTKANLAESWISGIHKTISRSVWKNMDFSPHLAYFHTSQYSLPVNTIFGHPNQPGKCNFQQHFPITRQYTRSSDGQNRPTFESTK